MRGLEINKVEMKYCLLENTKAETEAHRLATEALTVPPRNCDVGTPEERRRRYYALCNEISDRHERVGAHAPPFAFPSEFEWEDSPYENEETDGSK